jgi:protein-glutamine gamma-glutamyltransferase
MTPRSEATHLAGHLAWIQTAGYVAAVLVVVTPLTSTAGLVGALAGIFLGLAAARTGRRWRLRPIVALIGAALLAAAGIYADAWLGGPAWIARFFGGHGVLRGVEAVTFGCTSMAVVFGLRTLTARFPAFAVLEAAATSAVVVVAFAGHRHSNIGQPRQFAEWAFGVGYDPRWVLRLLGTACAAAGLLLLLRTRRPVKTGVSILLLAGLLFAAFHVSFLLVPDNDPIPVPTARNEPTQNAPADEPSPPGEQPSSPNEQSSGQNPSSPNSGSTSAQADKPPPPSQPPNEPDEPSFSPQDWPKRASPAAIVNLHVDYPSEAWPHLYFRENAYSRFNGHKLVHASEAGVDDDVPDAFPTEVVQAPDVAYDETHFHRLSMTISLIRPHKRPFGLTNVVTMRPRANLDPSSFQLTYEVDSALLRHPLLSLEVGARRMGDPNWSPAERAGYLELPADPRYRRLADEILAGYEFQGLKDELRNSDIMKALCIRRWIEQNMIYSLQADHSAHPDPVASYLFGNRRGYCVHVAHAMTYLLRSLGIPARLAGGYSVELSRAGKAAAILLTDTDRHAWCEVYVEGFGWQVIDAALEQNESPPGPPVDKAVQRYYGERNREPLPGDPRAENREDSRFAFSPLSLLWIFPAVLVIYAGKARRLAAPYLVRRRRLYRACYRAAADRLAEVGLVRRFGETREAFAERVFPLVPEFGPLTAMHVREAVTGENSRSRAEWLQALAAVTLRIRAAFPLGRRLIGRTRPLSWLKVA